MPEYMHTQTLQKTVPAEQLQCLERSDQNIVKDAQTGADDPEDAT